MSTKTKEPKKKDPKKKETAVQRTQKPARPPKVGVGSSGIEIKSMDDLYRFSTWVAWSGAAESLLEGCKTIEEATMRVAICVQKGLECSPPVKPMTAVNHSMIVNGRHSFFGDLPRAIVIASGLLGEREETFEGSLEDGSRKAVCRLSREDNGYENTFEFSIDDAKRANLWKKDVWQKYPDAMLKSKAFIRAVRDVVPDALHGIHIAEELEEAEVRVVETTAAEQLEEEIGLPGSSPMPMPAYLAGEKPVDPQEAPESFSEGPESDGHPSSDEEAEAGEDEPPGPEPAETGPGPIEAAGERLSAEERQQAEAQRVEGLVAEYREMLANCRMNSDVEQARSFLAQIADQIDPDRLSLLTDEAKVTKENL